MIQIEKVEVWGFEHAIRSARNALNSWAKSDSHWDYVPSEEEGIDSKVVYVVGEKDLDLLHRLYKGGSEQRKCLRQVFVSMDITTNQTVWSQIDTYKVGVTKGSCSKMHTIHLKEITGDDFSTEGIDEVGGFVCEHFEETLKVLNRLRNDYNNTHERKYWRALIELLPMGYELKATVTMNYENVVNIIHQRSGHKMFEWNRLVAELKKLPYIKEIMGE